MSDKKLDTPHSGMTLGDIYFVLFRRKWLILAFSLAGILAALAVCFIDPPQYKSEAELSLSVLEAKPIGVLGEENRPMDELSENIINTEIKILQSLDLAQQVVQAMTPEKILAGVGSGADTNAAAYIVKKGLTVEPELGSSVIHVTFQHPDKKIVQTVLSEVIDGYFIKHFKMRGVGGVFGDFLTNETARLRGELIQTEKQIQQAQSEAGVISTPDAKDAYSNQITKFHGQISSIEEELAERQAVLQVLNSPRTVTNGATAETISSEQYDAYRRICARLVILNKTEDAYLTQQGFTEENVLVKEVDSKIADAQKIKSQLEEKHPQLASMEIALLNPTRGTTDAANDLPNDYISIIQTPTPPLKSWSKKTGKTVGLLAAGGILGGLALAFLMELILDRSVKRPSEIETKLGLPLFISIPDAQKNGHGKCDRLIGGARLLLNNAPGNVTGGETPPDTSIAPWDREHPLRQFYEGLRDRLIVYFEVRNPVPKPKMVAVTSCDHGAGVSSIAAGLAATLSETGDGNVLLVNISGDRGAAQQFYNGEPGYSLDEVLETGNKCTLVKANLYTITERANGDRLPTNLPKKLSALMPKLKASDYDYIIFDMPPVNQTTATARLSALMDMVLLVIESEKTNQDVVKSVIKLLAESKVTVSTVLNRFRNYVPARLHREFLN
jgi:succinoglycan biosynthesis transport protein ExoP